MEEERSLLTELRALERALWRRNRDVVEAFVSRPPKDQMAALKLAKEQMIYCIDIVAQGTDTVEALAAGLLNRKKWSESRLAESLNVVGVMLLHKPIKPCRLHVHTIRTSQTRMARK